MSAADLGELKALAVAATPGPWVDGVHTVWQDDYVTDYDMVCKMMSHEDSAYIAAANPAAILTLIAKVESLSRANLELTRRFEEQKLQEARLDTALQRATAPTQPPMGEREAFEAWADKNMPYDLSRASDGTYYSATMDRAWAVWQARATATHQSQAPNIPAKPGIPSTLSQQVADAQAEVDTWPAGKLESIRLAGGDQP